MARTTKTKTERLREMLARPQGATLQALCKATGWQPHSARAALSRLRKDGCTITRDPAGDGARGGSVYRITNAPGTAPAAAPGADA